MMHTILNKFKFVPSDNENLRIMPLDSNECSYESKYIYIYTQYQSECTQTLQDENHNSLPNSPITQVTINVLHTNRILDEEELEDFTCYCIDIMYDTIRYTLECM